MTKSYLIAGLPVVAFVLLANAPAQPVQQGASDEPIVCKRVKRTGTRFTSRVCKSASEWEVISERARRSLEETVNRPQIEINR